MKLLKVPKECALNKEIPVEKFVQNENQKATELIESIIWSGAIKPEISNVEKTVTEKIRYEEIQLFQIRIRNKNNIYEIGKCIFSCIKYPCVIEFLTQEAVIIGVCRFNAGKIDYGKNVNMHMHFSHVFRKDILSEKAQRTIQTINDTLVTQNSIGEMYDRICNAITDYPLSGTSQSHVRRLVKDLLGNETRSIWKIIHQYCEPYEYHTMVYGDKFNGKKSNIYSLIYDYEEIWYCFMKCSETKKVIEYRRYRDIEDLIYSIDSKEW